MDYTNIDNLIILSNEVHCHKYDYSLLGITNNREKSKIICPIHGIFHQRIYMHIVRKQGCPKCVGLKLSQNDFINFCNIKHHNTYTYSRTVFKTKKDKITITCKIHGDFNQIAQLHMNGAGCPICAGCAKSNNQEFISKSLKIHGNKYDYSKVNYINAKTKVKIICKKHGEFTQTPNKHLSKQGCPKCFSSKGELMIEDILKNNNINYESQKKFTDCKFKRNLKFDFFLPDLNLCIEYDGGQHFEKYRFEKDEEYLNLRKKRDVIKDIYCKENDIVLYRITYLDDIINKINKIIQ